MLVVRPAGPADVPDLVVLMAELDRFYGDAVRDSDEQRAVGIREALFGGTALSRALVATDGSELAGLASYSVLWPAVGVTQSLYLKELYVREAWRRRGVGRLLLDEVRRVGAALGCSRVEWTTDVDNVDAQEFYAALGVEANTGKVMYRVSLEE